MTSAARASSHSSCARQHPADVALLGSVEHREGYARELDRVGRAFDCQLGVAHRVVVAAHVAHPGPELAVDLEERLVLFGTPGVGEIALHDDRVGIECRHLAHHRPVHHERIRSVTGVGAEDGPDRVGGRVAGAAALGLAEVHVVGGGDGREQTPLG